MTESGQGPETNWSRRSVLRVAAVWSAAQTAGAHAAFTLPTNRNPEETRMAEYTLPPLPYDFNALEPHIDAQTMEIHHGKHHNAYVTNLNNALKNHEMMGTPIEQVLANLGALPADIRTAVRNNGGGHLNHTWFWTSMKPGGGGEPSGDLARAIDADLGGFDAFKTAFSQAGATRFGSGWAWLVLRDGKLAVCSTANQDNPLMDVVEADQKGIPLLGLDVWEHAYYLKYQNRRPDYIAAWWNTVNWDEIARRYATAKG